MVKVMRKNCRRWHVLEHYIKKHDLRLGAELGVFTGQTTEYLLDNCLGLLLIGVDLWEPTPGYENSTHKDNETQARERVARFGDRVKFIRDFTAAAASNVQDGSLDFVFIDADHSYVGVLRDIAAWTPKVRVGGFIMGHDYQRKSPGVISAVDELFPDREVHDDSVWAVQKC